MGATFKPNDVSKDDSDSEDDKKDLKTQQRSTTPQKPLQSTKPQTHTVTTQHQTQPNKLLAAPQAQTNKAPAAQHAPAPKAATKQKWPEDYFVRIYNPISEWDTPGKTEADIKYNQQLLKQMQTKLYYKGVFRPAKRTKKDQDNFKEAMEEKNEATKLLKLQQLNELNDIDQEKKFQSEIFMLLFVQSRKTWLGRFFSMYRVTRNVVSMDFVARVQLPAYKVSIRLYNKRIGLNPENRPKTNPVLMQNPSYMYLLTRKLSEFESIKVTNDRWHEVKITFKPQNPDEDCVEVVQILFVKAFHALHFVLTLMNRMSTLTWDAKQWQSIFVRDGMRFKDLVFNTDLLFYFLSNDDWRHNFSSEYRPGTLQLK